VVTHANITMMVNVVATLFLQYLTEYAKTGGGACVVGGKWRSRLQQDSAGSEARGRAMHAGRSNARRRGNDRCAWAEVDRHAWKSAREETTRGRRTQAEGSARDACASVWTSRRNKPMNEKVKAWEMETCNHLHAACNPSQ
jgi:hypothetical protein